MTLLAIDSWVWFPFWLGIGLVFTAERVVSVWAGGPRARLLALALFPELLFDVFLDLVYVKGIVDIALGLQADWGHVVRSAPNDELQKVE